MYAHVALASELPVPKEVYFTTSGSVSLSFDLLSSASAWCKFLGGEEREIDEFQGSRYFQHNYSIVWHGWRIVLRASEPIKTVRAVPALPASLAEELSSLVSADQAAA
ncbi:hypothetical protein [Actinoplanes utahensis]|uniref:Uncharacterized protein n=1 Tax=Actinoplanes utahensis TaxID=1869 RepID=A0A0A6UK98_ACTUT|nr:hypothetical protein [Actinoplanes utahensis]KHD76550.1 hypothetical protein MB27_16220 [Actinoplanes utahensis]